MALFRYKVTDRSGKIAEKMVEANSSSLAMAQLRAEGLMPISLLSETGDSGHSGPKHAKVKGAKFDALDFTRRLGPLLRAHVQLARALSILEEGAPAGEGREVISRLRRGLHEGKKLSSLIRDEGDAFPQIYAGLIAAGEEGGLLAETISELEKFMHQRKELRSFMISNSIYPILVLTVTLGVILFLLFFVIPKFAATLQSSGKALPGTIQMMMNLNHGLTRMWFIWPMLAGGIMLLVWQIKRGGIWRTRWDTLMLKIPLWNSFVKMQDGSVYFRTLGMLTSNHIHLLSAIRTAIEVITNRVISRSLQHLPEGLKKGEKLSALMKQSPYVDQSYVQLVRIGEESGSLGDMINSVADMSETAMREYVAKLIALFVPVTILLLAVVVAFVVVSIFMAVMQMKAM